VTLNIDLMVVRGQSPREFMHDLYIAEIYNYGAVSACVADGLGLSSSFNFTHQAPEGPVFGQ